MPLWHNDGVERRNDRSGRKVPPPLDQPALEQLALRYLEKFSTTRLKLEQYLRRKIAERGWNGEAAPDPEGLAERMADLGYVDDRAWAEAKGAALGRRGYGERRVADALRHAGVATDDAAPAADQAGQERWERAMAFARRKRIGPFSLAAPDRIGREKALAAMLRAGHAMPVARRISGAAPGEMLAFDGE
jgi:regulatory protein